MNVKAVQYLVICAIMPNLTTAMQPYGTPQKQYLPPFKLIHSYREATKENITLSEISYQLANTRDPNEKEKLLTTRFCGEQSILHLAIAQGRIDTAAALLRYGADLNIGSNTEAGPPLHLAVIRGTLQTVEGLLTHCHANVNCRNLSLWTALHSAALLGLNEVAQCLIRHKAEVNAIGCISQRTPLHIAAQEGYINTVRILVGAGANPFIPDKYQRTPLTCCKESTYPIIASGVHIENPKRDHKAVSHYLKELMRYQKKAP